MKKKKQKRSNGHVTVARGMGWEGRGVGSSQRSYDRWALGEGGQGQRQGQGQGVGERRKGRGTRQGGPAGPPLWARRVRHSGPDGPFTLGQSGPSFWAHPACYPWARPARHLGPSGPPSIKPVS